MLSPPCIIPQSYDRFSMSLRHARTCDLRTKYEYECVADSRHSSYLTLEQQRSVGSEMIMPLSVSVRPTPGVRTVTLHDQWVWLPAWALLLVLYIGRAGQKSEATNAWSKFCQILTDSPNAFTGRFPGKFCYFETGAVLCLRNTNPVTTQHLYCR